eukprot:6855534-Prymnesium_polylepis.1
MLSLANLEVLPVVGDGNCGYYACLAAAGKIEHCERARMGTPPAADFKAQQELRDRCHTWLSTTSAGASLCNYQLQRDKEQNVQDSGWTSEAIADIKRGKARAGDRMGSYAGTQALRAMAVVENVHLVVITTRRVGKDLHSRERELF